MDKIRIGNDIRLNVGLNTSALDPININSIQVFLINTTLQSDLEARIKQACDVYNAAAEDKSIKYISRYPIEPVTGCYHSDKYNICHSGCPTYHVRPFCPKPPYCGFGVYPHSFDGFTNHLWAIDDLTRFKNEIIDAKNAYKEFEHLIQYRAIAESTANSNVIAVYFPAADQKELGVYKLVVVAKVYAPGYSKFTQFKTITIDYDSVFELVSASDMSGGDGANIITVGTSTTTDEINPSNDNDIYVNSGQYMVTGSKGESSIKLTLSDNRVLPSNIIDLSSETAWYEDTTSEES